ncbi:MAG: single-stranded DNA-binding protein [Clostridia bacterium]|nr:single-stranded DNA-binding protein [Clostridia bacterium]
MNKVILMGRLTRDVELRQTQQGTLVARLSLAVQKRFDKEQADFINCTAWQKTAEFVSKHFQKGSMIAVCGRIEARSWDDNGSTRYATEVVIEEAYFAGSRSDNNENSARSIPILNNVNRSNTEPTFDEFDAMKFAGTDMSNLPFDN